MSTTKRNDFIPAVSYYKRINNQEFPKTVIKAYTRLKESLQSTKIKNERDAHEYMESMNPLITAEEERLIVHEMLENAARHLVITKSRDDGLIYAQKSIIPPLMDHSYIPTVPRFKHHYSQFRNNDPVSASRAFHDLNWRCKDVRRANEVLKKQDLNFFNSRIIQDEEPKDSNASFVMNTGIQTESNTKPRHMYSHSKLLCVLDQCGDQVSVTKRIRHLGDRFPRHVLRRADQCRVLCYKRFAEQNGQCPIVSK
ncbi:hypothetical protein ACOME3_006710 [Neoechinorhynchus agilis]